MSTLPFRSTTHGCLLFRSDFLSSSSCLSSCPLLPQFSVDTVFVPPSITEFLDFFSATYSTLRSSLVSLNLLNSLAGATGLTIFAADNAAFQIAAQSIRFALDDPQYQGHLFQLILNHISMDELRISDIFGGTMTGVDVLSTQGTLSIQGTEIGFVRAGILEPDISLTTGQVHLIDTVLVPKDFFLGLLEVLATMSEHSIFAGLLKEAGFEFLNVLGPYTVLAPRNEAFDSSLLEFLQNSNNERALLYILLNHILPGNLYGLATAGAGFSIDSLAPQSLFFYQNDNEIALVNGATIPEGAPTTMTGNGVIYGIQSVLMPQTLADVVEDFSRYDLGGSLSTLSTGLTNTGLMDTVIRQGGAVTLFAPPDDAFTSLGDFGLKFLAPGWEGHLTLILLNHVAADRRNATTLSTTTELTMLSGTTLPVSFDSVNNVVSVSSIPVLFPDVKASNRFLHIVGGVFLPPPITMTFLSSFSTQAEFSTLVGLIMDAGLEADLNDAMGGPLTIFAPTNAAFAAADLGDIDPDSLRRVLFYHSVGQNLQLADLTDGMTLTTLESQTVEVSVTSGVVSLNGNSTVDMTIRNRFVGE